MIDMNAIDEIFESYNLAIQKKFEEKMHSVRNQEDYSLILKEARNEWEKSVIGGKVPEKIFSEVSFENLIEIFERAAVICDEFIPRSLADRIACEVEINDIAALAKYSDEIEVRIAAIGMLGLSGDVSCSDILIDLMYEEGEYADLIAEKARKALVDIGREASAYLEKRISGIEKPEGSDFHMIIALIEMASDKKSDATYSILRNAFITTGDKALAARCLADYGDGRAVTLLRGYLDRNRGNTDKDTILEIQGAILNLGGSLDGLE